MRAGLFFLRLSGRRERLFFMDEKLFAEYKKDIKKYIERPERYENQEITLMALDSMKRDLGFEEKAVRDYVMKISKYVHQMSGYMAADTGEARFDELYWRYLLLEAPYLVDSFMRYIERDDLPNKRFYEPRAKKMKPIIDAYQQVYDGELDFLSVSQPKRTGKTQGALRLGLQFSGRRPDRAMLAVGSGQSLAGSFYGGMLTLIDRPRGQVNRFFEVFPDAKMRNGEPFKTKADEMTIDFQSKKTFSTVTCRSIDGKIVGCTEATNLLYLDDTVANHEEAMNRKRLEFLCEKVAGDVLGRRIEGTPIIIQGTKYSLYDPITFLQNKAVEMGWRWKEVAIPALDPITDESNFTVFIDGRWRFTTEFYRNERKLVTEEVWEAEFQQNPFEAKGRMFPEKELNRYFELPVDLDPDAIVAVCDTAESGEDSTSMPIAYIYGEDVFIEDVVFDNSSSDVTKPQCAKKLVQHKVSTAVFESNNAGTYFARDVGDEVKKLGGNCSIRTKRTISNKLTRIEYASDNIKKHFYFKDKSLYEPNSQYGRFMKEVTTMTRSGKVPHDDAPDSLSLLENELRGTLLGSKKTRVVKSPY